MLVSMVNPSRFLAQQVNLVNNLRFSATRSWTRNSTKYEYFGTPPTSKMPRFYVKSVDRVRPG